MHSFLKALNVVTACHNKGADIRMCTTSRGNPCQQPQVFFVRLPFYCEECRCARQRVPKGQHGPDKTTPPCLCLWVHANRAEHTAGAKKWLSALPTITSTHDAYAAWLRDAKRYIEQVPDDALSRGTCSFTCFSSLLFSLSFPAACLCLLFYPLYRCYHFFFAVAEPIAA